MTLVIVGGATATGKTELAAKICKAINGELISADSMQIYKKMNIGTAKETEAELGMPIHCIDLVEPTAGFTVVDYKEQAEKDIKNIENRGKTPVICGGTGFYISSLVYDYSYGGSDYPEEKYQEVLADLTKELEEKGANCLHDRLEALDKTSANVIHPNNTKRLLRALTVCLVTGRAFSAQNACDKKPIRNDIKMFVIDYNNRDVLSERMRMRVDKMLEKGLEAEVADLLKEGVTFNAQSMQAIGYKEWRLKFENGNNTEEVAEEIVKNTKAYGKRQRTWFNNQYPFANKLIGDFGIDNMLNIAVDSIIN